jgi:hypothetical protein
MKKINIILSIFLCMTFTIPVIEIMAQEVTTSGQPVNKHEIGISVGVFPIIGLIIPPNDGFSSYDDRMGHSYYTKRGENYENMYHIGSYTFNYNYHINSKHSVGGSISWVGKHIETYWIYPKGSYNIADTVSGSGWKHYITMQVNYRYTYYRKSNISLYFGVHFGMTLCVRDKKILPKETIDWLAGSVSNVRSYFCPALQLNGIGIEIGDKNVFNMEIGIGTQGILKAGYKHKF